MAAKPGLGLLEALKMAQDRYNAEQAGKPPAKPFDLQQTLQGADKAIQQGVFGAVDAVAGEGKRLIDGKFGFDALSQALPQLAQSGPQNLAEALATTRQGGAQWTNQDLQAQRDRDNLGKAGGGAMDATWLLPAVPAAKGAIKGSARGLEEAFKDLRYGGKEGRAWMENPQPGLSPSSGPPSFSGPTMSARSGLGDNATYAARVQSTQEPTTLSAGFGFGGKDGERSLAQILGDSLKGKTQGSAKPPKVKPFTRTDFDPTPEYEVMMDGANDDQMRSLVAAMKTKDPDSPTLDPSYRDQQVKAWDPYFVQHFPQKGSPRELRTAFLARHGGDVDKAIAGANKLADELEATFRPARASILQDLAISPVATRRQLISNLRESTKLMRGGPLSEAPKPPTTLSAGFGFGGKDGEKPLWDSLRDVFKGKPAPAPNPLDQFTPPTSLDDIFTGGPRSPRADTGPLDPRQPEGPAFNASTPEVGYDGQGFTGLDARLGKGPQMSPSPADGPFAHTFKYDLPGGAQGEMKANIMDDTMSVWGSSIPEGMRGQGNGTAMYKAALDWAQKNGIKSVQSDATITRDAERVYEALARQGYNVERNPDAYFSQGFLRHQVDPVYQVRIGDQAAATQAKNRNTLAEALAKREQKPLGYDDWSEEWRVAFDKGLPMDQASRMARAKEQGFRFDRPMFRSDAAGLDTLNPSSNGATWMSSSPKVAEEYLTDAAGREAGQVYPVVTRGEYGVRDQRNFLDPRAIREGRQDGMDGVYAPQINDAPISGKLSDIQGVFDPSNIRSVNAAFDPANAGKPTLLGMGAGDSDLIKLLMSYGAFGGMSAGALATLEAQKKQGAGF